MNPYYKQNLYLTQHEEELFNIVGELPKKYSISFVDNGAYFVKNVITFLSPTDWCRLHKYQLVSVYKRNYE
jgi:hypothetical protein